VLKLPVTPLAAGCEREARFAKVFEKVADFPWHTRNPTLFGQCRKTSFNPWMAHNTTLAKR
jgi:hypothetical protein